MARPGLLTRLLATLGAVACTRSTPAPGADPGASDEPPVKNALCRPGLACVPGSACQARSPRGLGGPEYELCSCDQGGHFECPAPAKAGEGNPLICLPGACSPAGARPSLSERYASDCLYPVHDGKPPQTRRNGEEREECCYTTVFKSCEGRPLRVGGQTRQAPLRAGGWGTMRKVTPTAPAGAPRAAALGRASGANPPSFDAIFAAWKAQKRARAAVP